MGQVTIAIRDKNISSYLTTNKQLSILLGMDSFVYMLVSQGRVIAYKNYQLQEFNSKYPHLYLKDLQQTILQDEDLMPSFQKIFIGVAYPLAVVVPDGFYDEQKRRTFLNHLTDKADDLAIFTAPMPAIGAKVIYSLHHEVVNVLDHLLPTAHMTHIWAALINYLSEVHCPYEEGHHLFINFHSTSLDIFVFDRKWLLFSNTYSFGQAEDVLYYVMLVIQQLNLEIETIPVYLAGQTIEDSPEYRLLRRFLPRIEFFEEKVPYAFGSKMQKLPPQYWADITSISKG